MHLSSMYSVPTVGKYHGEGSKRYQFNTKKIDQAKFYLHAIYNDLLISWQDMKFNRTWTPIQVGHTNTTLDSEINVAPGITVAPPLLKIFTSWF